MRYWPVVAATVTLLACSSTPTTVTPPPPPGSPTPGAPASIVLVSGDGQSAAPGALLPVKLAVQVKDAAGVAVPGAVVHFAVDSGGGSLSASSVTTGSGGTATGVSWTLGSSSGTNVVAVTVGTLPAVRFHAQALGVTSRTLFSNMAVGSGGGTFMYTKSGDALTGLTLMVMPGAYSTGSTWTIVADSSAPVTLPAGFVQVGPTLVIGNSQGFADSVMTLTMPMHIGSDNAVAPFYFDPASGTLEGIPLVARTDSSATLATRHFSVDLMAIPGSGAVGSLRSNLRAGFGNVRVVWVAIPQALLVGTFSSSFLPGVDDWEFINYGDYLAPSGDCEGMSITAMYYHYLFRLGPSPAPGLYHHYDQSIANQWDNVAGIRYAGTVQADYLAQFASGLDQIVQLWQTAGQNGSLARNLTASWIALTLKLTGRPVLVALQRQGAGHAVVAYAVTSDLQTTIVSVADPNRPGMLGVNLTYDLGVMRPVNFQVSALYRPDVYFDSYALGVSGEVSLTQLATRWTEFTQGTAGADRYAKHYRVDIENQFDRSWSPLTASVVSYSQQVDLRTVCTDCVSNPADSIQQLAIWDSTGHAKIHPPSFQLATGPATPFNAVEGAARGVATDTGFLDVMPFSIVYQPVTITGPASWDPNVPLTFTVQNPPDVAGAHYQFEWDFGDGTSLVDINDNPNASHTYLTDGDRTVTVAVTDVQTGHVIARAAIKNTVGAPTPVVQLFVSGNWPNQTAPALGDYHYTDLQGNRIPLASPGVDAIIMTYDNYTTDNVNFSAGIWFTLVIPAGSALQVGQTFTKFVTAPPILGAGQFQLTLASDLNHPEGPCACAPGNSGGLTITAVNTLSDGSTVISFTYSISNGLGGTISGSGVGGYR